MVVKKENGKNLFSKNLISKMKKKDPAPITKDKVDGQSPDRNPETFVEVKNKTRQLTQLLADRNEAHNWNKDQDFEQEDMHLKEAEKLSKLLPEPPNGKRRFIDYFVKVTKMK